MGKMMRRKTRTIEKKARKGKEFSEPKHRSSKRISKPEPEAVSLDRAPPSQSDVLCRPDGLSQLLTVRRCTALVATGSGRVFSAVLARKSLIGRVCQVSMRAASDLRQVTGAASSIVGLKVSLTVVLPSINATNLVCVVRASIRNVLPTASVTCVELRAESRV